jgi:hypothetical protein
MKSTENVWVFGALLLQFYSLTAAQYIQGDYAPGHAPISTTCGNPGLKDQSSNPGINGWACASSYEAKPILEYQIVNQPYGPPENFTLSNVYFSGGTKDIGVLNCA